MSRHKPLVQVGKISERILLIRGQKVIIDADLAEFYTVSTKQLNQQVKRNKERFPQDFMFQLTDAEKSEVVTNCDHLEKLKYSGTLPYAFTEHGAIMVAGILNSARAVNVSIFIVRAFIKLRETISQHKELVEKLTQLERGLADHDQKILALVAAIKHLMTPEPVPRKRRIGFHTDD